MEQTTTILENILKKLEDINSVRKRVVAEERANPERRVSGWGDVKTTLLQLFIEYTVTNGLGYRDSFYWDPPNQLPSEYEKLKNMLILKKLEDEWSGINPRQVPAITSF